MLLAKEKDSLETNRSEEQGTFRIKATGKAFRVLIDGLYANKAQSIVRELASNAFDSHIAAKTSKPFFIHVPTTMRPEFYVRDYGIGMSHQKVMNLYSTLFDSDKDEDNDLVGMFGLGSKSPFAYTDQFYVTCYDGSEARHYSAAIGPGGVPQIILMHGELCDEAAGVRVGFAVQGKDHASFIAAVKAVSLGFDPIFETNSNQALNSKGKLALSGTGWASYTDSNLPDRWCVKQGCVIYPLKNIGGLQLPNDGYNSPRRYLIDCPIGTIEVTTSREDVSYKPHVIKYIEERLARVVKEAADTVEKMVEKFDNVAEFYHQLNRIKPEFCKRNFVHPKTGLTGPSADVVPPMCFFHVGFDDRSKHWNYTPALTFDAELPSPTLPIKQIFIIEDLSKLLDANRDIPNPASAGNTWSIRKEGIYTDREYRRLIRRMRGYLESKGIAKGLFALGVKWSDDMWNCLCPASNRVLITTDDLNAAIPKRNVTHSEKIIRGVSIARINAEQQEPIKSLEASPKRAWVSSEMYRANDISLKALGKRFGLEAFYVTSTHARQKVIDAGIKRIDETINELLKANHNTTWDDVCAVAVNSYGGNGDYLLNFVSELLKKAPDSYLKLKRSRTIIGEIVRLLKPMLEPKVLPVTYDLIQIMRVVNRDPDTKVERKLVTSAPITRVLELRKQLDDNYRSPLSLFLGNVSRGNTKEQLKALTEALIAVAHNVPITLKF
jgi:hypothetical protein